LWVELGWLVLAWVRSAWVGLGWVGLGLVWFGCSSLEYNPKKFLQSLSSYGLAIAIDSPTLSTPLTMTI